jgi:hypothetical protein
MSISVRPTMYGNIAVSAIVNDYFEENIYSGYSPKEAVILFACKYELDDIEAFLEINGQKLPIPDDETEDDE